MGRAYSAIERNPATHALSDALDRYLGRGASLVKRSERALADVEELRGLFATRGLAEVSVQTVARMVRFASVTAYVRVQFAATPLAALLADGDPAARERVIALVSADVSAMLAPRMHKGGLAFLQEVHIALATA